MPVVSAQVILRVDPDASPGGNGQSWASAYTGLHEALSQAAALATDSIQTTIWLRHGIYPTDGVGAPPPGTGRTIAFELSTGVRILGGFAGNESDESERDPEQYLTILSGEIGNPATTSDNAYQVVRFIAPTGPVTRWAELDGLTIQKGNANATSGDNSTGGGVLTRFTLLTIRNCTFVQNGARQGGGIFSRNGELIIEDSRFISNTASTDGGAVYSQSELQIRDSRFDSNTASFGGAILACCRPIDIRHSSFEGNFASWGGAIHLPSGTPVLAELKGFSNSASRGGFLHTSTPVLGANLRLGSNIANNGGAIYTSANLSMANATLIRNSAFENGGAIHVASGNLALQHVTAYDNQSLIFGGMVYAGFGSITIDNSIIAQNSDNAGSTDVSQVYTSALATRLVRSSILTDFTGAVPAIDVIDAAPHFVDPFGPDGILGTPDDDLSLEPTSPAILAASLALVPNDYANLAGNGDTSHPLPFDLRRNPRVITNPDMGAYEFLGDVSVCPGDVNGDLVVDLADFNILAINFGSGPGMTREQGDLNGDGHVDLADFNILAITFGSICVR